MAPSLGSLMNKPTIKLTLEQEMIFVRPPLSPDSPSEDPFVRGTVLLSLPKRRLCKRLRVVVEGLADAFGGIGFPYESTTTLRKELLLDLLEHGPLEAGDHLMRFEILIPSSTAVFQRCSHGRVRHSVRAFLEFPKAISSTKLSTDPTAFWISATLKNPGDPPDPLDAYVQHFCEHLGPLIVRVSSPHLTVSSLIYAQVEFLSPPLPSLKIIAISSFIAQTFVVSYKEGQIALPPTRRHLLTKVDPTLAHATLLVPTGSRPISTNGPVGSSPLAPVDPIREDPNPLKEMMKETPWTYEMVCRIPRDEIIRPTTLPGTVTPIKVNHRLIVEIRFRLKGEKEDRLLTMGRACCIASCCCLSDSALPPYTSSASETVVPIIQPLRNRCLCNVSLEEMFDSEGSPLQRVGTLPVRPPAVDLGREEATTMTAVMLGIPRRSERDAKTAPAHLGGMEGRV